MRCVFDAEERLVAEQHRTQEGKITTPTTYTFDIGGGKIKVQELDFSGEANVMVGIEGTSTSIGAGEVKRIETRYDDRDEAVEVKVFNSYLRSSTRGLVWTLTGYVT